MRSRGAFNALWLGEALLAGCALASLGGCVEPRGITAGYGVETSADSIRKRGTAPLRDFIGEVRLGHGLDKLGKVPPGRGASRFAVGDPIHLSMWEVTETPAGSVVFVLVRDATDRIVWSEDQKAPHGGSYLSFDFGRALARGRYRADVIIDDEVRNRTDFEVFEWKDE